MNARSLLSPWKVLVAAAIFAAATPAQAGLSIVGIQNSTQTQTGGSSGTLSFAGYTFTYDITSLPATTSTANDTRILTLTGTLTSTGTPTDDASFTFRVLDDAVSSPTGPAFRVGASMAQTSAVGLTSSSTFGQVSFGGSAFTSGIVNGVGSTGRNFGTALPNDYDLAGISTEVATGPGAVNISFTSTATVQALPEPGSVIAGLMGLPCVGAVLAFARRRVGGVIA